MTVAALISASLFLIAGILAYQRSRQSTEPTAWLFVASAFVWWAIWYFVQTLPGISAAVRTQGTIIVSLLIPVIVLCGLSFFPVAPKTEDEPVDKLKSPVDPFTPPDSPNDVPATFGQPSAGIPPVKIWQESPPVTIEQPDPVVDVEFDMQELLDALPTLAWLSDGNGDRTDFNALWLKFTGRRIDEELSNGWMTRLHPDDRQAYLQNWRAAFTARRLFQLEYRLQSAGGTYRWISEMGAPQFDEDKVFHGYIGACMDVSEVRGNQKDLEQRCQDLAARCDQLEQALTGANVGMWDWDVITGQVYFSPQYKRQIGLPVDYALNGFDGWKSYLHPDDHDEAVQRVQDYFEGRLKEYISIFRMKHTNGEYRWILSQGDTHRNARGEILRMIGVHVDITERKRAEEKLKEYAERLKESNRDLEQFAYAASHDLQEPLRAVSGYCQLLQRKYGQRLGEQARKYTQSAVDGAQRMHALLQGLLSYSRISRQENRIEQVDMQQVWQQAQSNLEVAILESAAQISNAPLPTIYADPTQMLQLLQNLLGNAIKYCEHRTPVIHLSVSEPNGFWQFSLKDNGIGIPAEYLEKIFVIFQRLHTRENFAGYGIGLSLCKRIVDRHAGEIWVDSFPEQGSTFHFTIPKNINAPAIETASLSDRVNEYFS